MTDYRDVVVTGVGVACPLGVGTEAVWQALESGASGVRCVPELAAAGFPSPLAGQVLDLDPKEFVKPRKALKVMSRETQLGFSAAEIAWRHAGLTDGAVDPDRFGVLCGSNMFCPDVPELAAACRACDDGSLGFDFSRWGKHGLSEMFPLWMLKYLPNMTPCHIGIAHDARGPTNSIVAGDVSGLLAIAEGIDTVARGHADVMLVGGVSTMLELMDLMWHGTTRLSQRCDAPTKACRPFDADRDGLVGAEAAAFFVIERRAHAAGRGARPLAEAFGFARRYEACSLSLRPSGRAVRQAIDAALQDAGVVPNDLAFVAAHGLSCVEDDRFEAQAIAASVGETPVVGFKSYYGHCGAASGAIDLAASLLALQRQAIPATLNFERPDPECPVNVSARLRTTRRRAALVVSHRSTGQAAALVLAATDAGFEGSEKPTAAAETDDRPASAICA